MTCLEVRDRLTEHSLGILPRVDAREVDRHLEWCAGCRKEASELLEGAGAVALSLPAAEPPTALEGRILERFRIAAGRVPLPSRNRLRVLIAATLAAAILAMGSIGWAVEQQRNAQSLKAQVLENRNKVADLLQLLSTFQGSGRTYTATLLSPTGFQGYGQAIMFSAPKSGFLLVDVPVLPKSGGPYQVQLVGKSVIDSGQLNPASGDHPVLLKWFDGEPLAKMTVVTIIDESTGAVVLTGKLQLYQSS